MTGATSAAATAPGWPRPGSCRCSTADGPGPVRRRAAPPDEPTLVPVGSTCAALRARPAAGCRAVLRGLVRPPRPAAGRRRRGGRRPRAAARRRCPGAERDRVAARPGPRRRSPPSSATPPARGRPGPGLHRAGLRLADRRRAAQPARRGHRAAAAGHPGLRPPDADALADHLGRRWPAGRRRRPSGPLLAELDRLDAPAATSPRRRAAPPGPRSPGCAALLAPAHRHGPRRRRHAGRATTGPRVRRRRDSASLTTSIL